MWHKYDERAIWIWLPTDFVIYPSMAFFTLHNNVLNKQKQPETSALLALVGIATIIIYENDTNEQMITDFHTLVNTNIPVIGIFSFKQNRYSKPYTGGFELFIDLIQTQGLYCGEQPQTVIDTTTADTDHPNKIIFKMEWSIMVSHEIGISNKYKDRAFAYNIGIPMPNVSTPDIFFKRQMFAKTTWAWPRYILSSEEKNKLFQFEGEIAFNTFLRADLINIIVITGPPLSGKTILAKRIIQYLGRGIICKYNYLSKIATMNTIWISSTPKIADKQKILNWLLSHHLQETPPHLVWIEIKIARDINYLFRHLLVQLATKTHTTLPSSAIIKKFYNEYEVIDPENIPEPITHIHFPIILKKIKELYYIY